MVTMSSLGGGPVSIKLNQYSYRDSAHNGELIEMLPDCKAVVPEATFAAGTFSSSKVPHSCSVAPGTYDATSSPIEIVYTYSAPTGGALIKRYRFSPDSYDYQLVVEASGREKLGFERQYELVWNNPLGVTEPEAHFDYEAMEAVAMMSGSREKLAKFEDGKLNESLTGSTTWAGVRAKYFSAVLIPRNRVADGVFAKGRMQRIQTAGGTLDKKEITAGLELPFELTSSFADTFTVFVGPLDYTLMAGYHVGLQDMLDIGTTPYVGWIIKPFALAIIWLLPKMYMLVANYGLVIILFALLIKIITLPLSLKQYKSMNAMKEVAPKVEELRKRLKNNPQQLNSETMKLYKEHGVNPVSGCLPLLAQMPLFIAMFSVFRSTILLRGAPFVWPWLDLSRGATGFTDPYIIMVILMVVFQFISQKLTMAANQQNKMLMYMMPLIFGFLFYKLSAGLVLYWTVFSLFSIGDYFVFRRQKNAEVKTV
jgi:YidC/Oxa1 family membrane protein insertase